MFRATYGYADLGRAGLANKLFPFARCIAWCHANRVPMLASHFFQTPIGPLLRGERDLRLYTNLFVRPSVRDLARRTAALRLLPIEDERGDQTFPEPIRARRVYRFAGLGRFFETLNDEQPLITEEIRKQVHPRWLREAARQPAPELAIHVRLGDFSGNMRHPVEWYASALQFVREVAGWPVPARVFSDGTPEQLAPLLSLPDTSLVSGNNAVTDLLLLARSRYLIATGSSTFSAWAVYFGQMPALCRPGNPVTWWHLKNREGHFIGEVDFASPPDAALADIRRVFGRDASR